ncbi:MAG TPA: high frequency lysogenization protein HflD [Rudaea sp.]|jgi:high frequency lysogenization protein|nr:high frequency lysogenization protein HflD [Rudaea sp.]
MREGRVIALAGVMQALALVRSIAQRGSCDATMMRASLISTLRIDAESPEAVYGGLANLRLGLETLVAQFDTKTKRDIALTRMAVSVLRLERSVSRRSSVKNALRASLLEMAPLQEQAESGNVDICARLAKLYSDNISALRPRVMVEGNSNFLQQPTQVNQIRALLLAAIRAAVLWRQLGGSPLRMLFRQREYAMLARGLCSGCTLDRT